MTALISRTKKTFKFKYFIFNYAFYMHLHGCLSYVCTRGRRKEAKSFHTFVEYLEASIYKLY